MMIEIVGLLGGGRIITPRAQRTWATRPPRVPTCLEFLSLPAYELHIVFPESIRIFRNQAV